MAWRRIDRQPKRALTHQDYDSWRSIQAPKSRATKVSSPMRSWAQDGDSEIVVRNRGDRD